MPLPAMEPDVSTRRIVSSGMMTDTTRVWQLDLQSAQTTSVLLRRPDLAARSTAVVSAQIQYSSPRIFTVGVNYWVVTTVRHWGKTPGLPAAAGLQQIYITFQRLQSVIASIHGTETQHCKCVHSATINNGHIANFKNQKSAGKQERGA